MRSSASQLATGRLDHRSFGVWLTLALVLLPAGVSGQTPVGVPAAAPALNLPTVESRDVNAPALVPVDLSQEQGEFRIAPPYVEDPAMIEKAGVPKGRVARFLMRSSDSRIFPAAPGTNGAEPAPFDRIVAVYLPPNYRRGEELPFTIVQDERWYLPEDAPMQADRLNRRTDLAFLPPMLDNLIAQARIPRMAVVMVSPGPGQQRSIEYDTVSDRYTQFIETEVLPKISRDYGVVFTKNPDGRATFGESSGAACALTMAWLHPELYHRVISYSGTFVALRPSESAPNGAWEFHDTLIPGSPRLPLRIWLHVSDRDNGYDTPVENKRNWVAANTRMAEALKAKGYPYQFIFAEGAGHVSRPVQRQTMPEAFEWAWKGYAGVRHSSSR